MKNIEHDEEAIQEESLLFIILKKMSVFLLILLLIFLSFILGAFFAYKYSSGMSEKKVILNHDFRRADWGTERTEIKRTARGKIVNQKQKLKYIQVYEKFLGRDVLVGYILDDYDTLSSGNIVLADTSLLTNYNTCVSIYNEFKGKLNEIYGRPFDEQKDDKSVNTIWKHKKSIITLSLIKGTNGEQNKININYKINPDEQKK